MGAQLPYDLEFIITESINSRYEDIIRSITKDYYNDYKDILSFNPNAPNQFSLKYRPSVHSFKLYINGVYYNDECYILNRQNKTVTWILTDVNHGFDLLSHFDYIATYDIFLNDNPNLQTVFEVI